MSEAIPGIRGMHAIFPDESPYWQRIEAAAGRLFAQYGYGEIRLPALERTELFSRSIGAATDVVQKEMFTFDDRDGDSLTLRPEGTAGCLRAALEKGLLYNQRQRFWYAGAMFRYEKPQKGRYRQFHQIGAEAFGFPGPDIDAELILLSARLWRELGLDHLRLRINSLGTPESRRTYRERLVEHFGAHRGELDEDSRRRLASNPMRILDSKVPAMQELIASAPPITEHLDEESARHFDALRGMLDDSGIACTVDPLLVRGLDYYTRTVFEWESDRLGAQAAVCSGGRYDGLVEELGGRPTPAVGWAMGLERLVLLLREAGPAEAPAPHAYLVMVGERAERAGVQLAERLRDRLPALRLRMHCGGGGFRAQMKQADRSGAALAIILGEDEVAAGEASLKPLRGEGAQTRCRLEELAARVEPLLAC